MTIDDRCHRRRVFLVTIYHGEKYNSRVLSHVGAVGIRGKFPSSPLPIRRVLARKHSSEKKENPERMLLRDRIRKSRIATGGEK